MDLKEFRNCLSEFFKTKFGNQLPILIHNGRKVYLKIVFPSGSSPEPQETPVDEIFVDKRKKRVFYVGKDEPLRHGILFGGGKPMSISIGRLRDWAERPNKYDGYSVHFAWKYDSRDEVLYNYAPLTGKIEAEPSIGGVERIVLHADEDFGTFRTKAKNLHERDLHQTPGRGFRHC